MGASIGKRGRGIPMPIMPTENIGMMSGAIRKKGEGRRRDERGSRRGRRFSKVTQFDGSTKVDTGKILTQAEYESQKTQEINEMRKKGIMVTPEPYSMYLERQKKSQPGFDPTKPSAVQETTRVNVQDPTLGGPPEREVPIPKERTPRITTESDPRGPAPFAPDDNAAKDRFFETMFERAANQKERRAIDKGERRDRQEAMRDEARMRNIEMGGNRRRRRDFTRRRPEKRRSREERAAFRDRYVSTLGSNFFS